MPNSSVGDVGDRDRVADLLRERRVDTVMHFAARTIVPESVADPLRYYGNNTCATRNLLACCAQAGVRHIVFSSTAAVYGIPEGRRAPPKTARPQPINPYGTSKLMSEWMLRDLAAAGGPCYVALRYFNVAGSDPARTHRPVHAQCHAADEGRVRSCGRQAPARMHFRQRLPDAGRHRRARLHSRRRSGTRACGCARLFAPRRRIGDAQLRLRPRLFGARSDRRGRAAPTVRVCACVERPRRAGDPPVLVADAQRIREVLGWQPRCDDLDLIAHTSLAWERKLADARAARRGMRKVSVLIPTYNCSARLVCALQSIAAQRYALEHVEALVIDDGSTDDTAERVAAFAAQSPLCVRYVRQVNAGPAAARNHGLRLARGEAIAFLDADDAWHPEKLRKQSPLLGGRIGLVYCGVAFVDAQGDALQNYVRRIEMHRGDFLLPLFCDFFLLTSAVVLSRAVVDVCGEFNEQLAVGEDYEISCAWRAASRRTASTRNCWCAACARTV